MNQVTADWRKLHNEELHMFFSPDIRIIKSRRMILAGNVASSEEI
jgi:hypothetical protein